ncbi:hypothetical protein HDR60_00810 [bacterium]|nr:hypothetical protein [bacterium]
MADKYVIQIAKEDGAQTCEKDENGENKKTSDGRCIVASTDTENQINFVCDNDNINLEGIDKKIKNKLQNNESFTKKREEYNQANYRIILKDVGTHKENELFLFSAKSNCIDCESLFSTIKSYTGEKKSINEEIENLITEIKNLNDSNLICWDEFCHIEEFYEDDNKNKILKKMNRLYITPKNFDKEKDILCFININDEAKNGEEIFDPFNYEEIHECEN